MHSFTSILYPASLFNIWMDHNNPILRNSISGRNSVPVGNIWVILESIVLARTSDANGAAKAAPFDNLIE